MIKIERGMNKVLEKFYEIRKCIFQGKSIRLYEFGEYFVLQDLTIGLDEFIGSLDEIVDEALRRAYPIDVEALKMIKATKEYEILNVEYCNKGGEHCDGRKKYNI